MVQGKLDHGSMMPARRVAQLRVRADFSLRLGKEADVAQDAIVQLFDAVQQRKHRKHILVELQAPLPAPNHVNDFQSCRGVWRLELYTNGGSRGDIT